ncbi:MAG: V-type ATP synthase subunit A, partial [Candidatus Altiarchaeales archaeon]|nr:V-type ATP synthase subunit A [Candidatus Altiarchaeales archaeon]
TGVYPGEPVEASGAPLSVELGPGLMGSIFDGIQRPLEVMRAVEGDFINRGTKVDALSREKKWDFKPLLDSGEEVAGGTVLGTVQETEVVEHKVLVPPNVEGRILEISGGKHKINEAVCILEGGAQLSMMHTWPVKKPRPIKKKLIPREPLITGQRVIDVFFPISKGGTAAIPGPFGAGKTVAQHQFAKWSDADIIVYVGCGERGNEMTEVLDEFPQLEDPRTGRPLLQRTILIANTSDMPVAAREASVYTGITIAEYFRDMGYRTALMADSTSRWAEAMREISSRLEEMPGEEGYPAYMGSRLAEFYERAGRIKTHAGLEGSLTVTGSVSPPGGDFSEPVTQNTLRITRVFWGLDARLAGRRHFPAIDWLKSYSLYGEDLREWYSQELGEKFKSLREEALSILQRENELLEIVQLVGADALPASDRLLLQTAKVLREDFLQQDVFDENDTFCSLKKQLNMLSLIIKSHHQAQKALTQGASIEKIIEDPLYVDLSKMKYAPEKKLLESVSELKEKINKSFTGGGDIG